MITTRPRRRTRVLGALAATVALLGLAACAGADAPAPTETAGTGNLKAAGDSGVLANVVVSDNVGAAPSVTIGDLSGLGDELQHTTFVEGDGAPITPEDVLLVDLAVYDGQSKQEQSPYATLGQPFTTAKSEIPFFAELFEGVPAGSRVVAVVPGAVLSPGSSAPVPPAVIVADVTTSPSVAWGTPAEPTQDLVQVTAGDDGRPQVTVTPGATPPAELVVDPVLVGDGPVVAEGDSVVLQYQGVLFADGTTFDSSWDRGMPSQFATGDVVPGFGQALVGQPVGSRVVAIIPPDLAYGDAEQGGIPAGSTLVFVIDVLAVA